MKKWLKIIGVSFLVTVLTIVLVGVSIWLLSPKGATFSRVKTWTTGETLTAAQLNAEFDNFLDNLDPTGIDDESASDAAAQATSDPYASSSLVKATSLETEIQQLRYLIAQITGETYWYIDPDNTIAAIDTFLASLSLTDHGILVGSGTSPVTPLAVMTNGQLVIGATGADPAPKTLSGDATLAADGALTLASNSVETAQIKDANVTAAKLASNAVTAGKIATGGVSAAAQLASNVVETAKIKDGNVTAAKLATGVIGAKIPGLVVRSKFEYKDTDEIYLYPASYHHDGTTERMVYWDSTLTFTFANLAASDWSYVYLDDSAIVTADTDLISATELVDSTTEPAWSDAKHGWYNGEDRCIFAVLTNGSSQILEFFHNGNLVLFADQITDLNGGSATSFTDVTMTMPKFTTLAEVTMRLYWYTGAGTAYWRTNGQSGSTGHYFANLRASNQDAHNTLTVITDSSQIIEYKVQTSDLKVYIYTDGWYFPIGM